MPYDLFISYSRRDNENGRVSQLVERIGRDFESFAGRPLRVFFDKNDIQGMDDWRQKIQQSLRESHLFLAVLSPDYLASPYCRWEWEDYVRYEAMRQCLGEGVAPVFFVTLPDATDAKTDPAIAGWIKEIQDRQTFDLRPWHDSGEQALQQAHVKSTLEQLQTSVRERLDRSERARRSPDNLIRHNPAFVGRVRELTEMRSALVHNKLGVVGAREGQVPGRATVQGLGGMGKTELALAYAHAFAWDYPGGRWQIGCEHIGDLRIALLQLAGALKFEFTDDENKSLALGFERVLRELNQRERCLLVLDNVSDPSILEPEYLDRLPRDGRVDLIATTRLAPRNIPGSAQAQTFIAVDELPEEDALALLRSHQPQGRFPNQEEDDQAREIVRLLEGFTLAVETAGIYLGRYAGEVTCAQFLSDLRARLLEHSEDIAGDATVAVRHRERLLEKTLAFTLETLSPEALHVLNLAALLPAESVALPWLQAVGAEQFGAFNDGAEVPNSAFQQTAELLLGLRLFQTGGVKDSEGHLLVARMHRLVQDLVKIRNAEALTELRPALIFHLRARSRLLWDGWMPHERRWEVRPLISAAWQWMEQGSADGVYLTSFLVKPLLQLADFAGAEQLLRRALALTETDGDESNAISTLAGLAQVLQNTNRLAEAEPLMNRAVALAELHFGHDHPETATNLNNLALLLYATNRTVEAEPLLRRALAIDERYYGPVSIDVARDLQNLGGLLYSTNRMEEAEPLMSRALAIRELKLSSNHPDVATCLSNLAMLLKARNKFSEAEPLLRRALMIDEQCFGLNHPSVASSACNLAQLLLATNRLTEAEPLCRQALMIDEANFGSSHPKVAIRLSSLAAVLCAASRPTDAEPYLRRAVDILTASVGEDHPHVGVVLNNLAGLLYSTNRLAEAEVVMRAALEVFVKFTVFAGHEHPHLSQTVEQYASLLRRMGRSQQEIQAQLNAVGRPFGMQFGGE